MSSVRPCSVNDHFCYNFTSTKVAKITLNHYFEIDYFAMTLSNVDNVID